MQSWLRIAPEVRDAPGAVRLGPVRGEIEFDGVTFAYGPDKPPALKGVSFRVREGVSGMPTAFVAEYGSGKPVIGILAEYDALPELSQEASGERKPVAGRGAGHGCGHCALGTAAVGAALAVKAVYDKHHLPGTIRLYGTPAEETVIGKVYMTLDGQFDDLDACLHWHPGTQNSVSYMSSKAVISSKFTFTGLGFVPGTTSIFTSGNNLILRFQPTPEPAHVLLACAGVAGVLAGVRKRRKK